MKQFEYIILGRTYGSNTFDKTLKSKIKNLSHALLILDDLIKDINKDEYNEIEELKIRKREVSPYTDVKSVKVNKSKIRIIGFKM